MDIVKYIALMAAAIAAVGVSALFVDWLFNRTCNWCGQGPGTMRHYLEVHTNDGSHW
jgi:hypothetical protein